MSNDDIIDDVIKGRLCLWCVELMKAYEVQILMTREAREIGVKAHTEGCKGDNAQDDFGCVVTHVMEEGNWILGFWSWDIEELTIVVSFFKKDLQLVSLKD